MAIHVISRTGYTSADVTVAYQVSADDRSGATSANAADFPGGAFPSGTVTLPAGGGPVNLVIQANPDSTVEPDETYKVTLTSTDPSVSFAGGRAVAYGTITNDDASGGGGAGSTPTAPTDSADLAASSSRDFDTTKTTHRITLPARSAGLSAEIYVAYDGVGDFVDIVIDATSILIKKIDDFNNTGTPVSVAVDTKQTIVIDKLTDSVEVRAGGTLVATMTGVTFPGTKTRVYTNVAIPGYVSTATNV